MVVVGPLIRAGKRCGRPADRASKLRGQTSTIMLLGEGRAGDEPTAVVYERGVVEVEFPLQFDEIGVTVSDLPLEGEARVLEGVSLVLAIDVRKSGFAVIISTFSDESDENE